MKYYFGLIIVLSSSIAYADLCDLAQKYRVKIEPDIVLSTTNGEYNLANPIFDLVYHYYNSEDFMSVTFLDQTMETAILEQGLLWPYGDVIEDTVVKTELSQSYCN